jgi:hypothetical protein
MGQRRLSDISPKIIFWSDNINASYPKIEPASVHRDWMHKTHNKLAYMCTPLLEAMSNGWEIKLPQDVVVKWNGLSEGLDGENASNVSIISGEFYNDIKIVSLDTGIGTVTFLFNLIAETDEDHYLTISGPPNYIFKDAEPLTGLVRSNRFTDHPLQLTWKLTSPNTEIVFPKGMPICFISINKNNTIESTEVEVREIGKDKNIRFNKYTTMRSNYFKKNKNYNFPQFYKNGINENGEKVLNSIKKIVLKPIKYVKDSSVEL